MSDADIRAMVRAAAILLVASLVRVAWSPGRPPPGGGGEDVLPALVEETRTRTAEVERRSRPLSAGELLDPNQAEEEDLDRLPGVGPATARAWVRTRKDRGGFHAPEDLLTIPGVGPALLDKVRPHLSWTSAPPRRTGPRTRRPGGVAGAGVVGGAGSERVDLNRADTTELRSLPGVGPALARRIVQARREARFRAVEDLLRVRGIGPATLDRLRPLVSVRR